MHMFHVSSSFTLNHAPIKLTIGTERVGASGQSSVTRPSSMAMGSVASN